MFSSGFDTKQAKELKAATERAKTSATNTKKRVDKKEEAFKAFIIDFNAKTYDASELELIINVNGSLDVKHNTPTYMNPICKMVYYLADALEGKTKKDWWTVLLNGLPTYVIEHPLMF